MPRSPSVAPRTETLTYQNQLLTYQLHFRARRTLGLVVRPDGSVHVSAPRGTTPAWVAAQVLRKAPWILKHQTAFQLRPPAPPVKSRLEAGAQLYFLGQPYRLNLVAGPAPAVELAGDELRVVSPEPLSADELANRLAAWYTRQAAAQFAVAMDQVWPQFAGLNLSRPILLVRLMRTRWGSCTHRTGRIRLSRDLVRASPACIAYVLLHECCHLLVPNHSAAFYELQTKLLPDWPRWKQDLNALPK